MGVYTEKFEQWTATSGNVWEVKVRWSDAQKATLQLTDTCSHRKQKHRKATVIPVLAIPSDLQDEPRDYGNWSGLPKRDRQSWW